MKDILLCIINVLLLVAGQLLFRLATQNTEIVSVRDIAKIAISPAAILAIVLYGGATLLWMYILTRVPLSFAYPIQVLAFPLVVIFSMLFFHEIIPLNRWIGVSIIVIGAVVASVN